MFCPNCGTKNDDNVKFCSNCGNSISIDFNNTSSENNKKKNNEFKPLPNFGRIKTQIDSIKDQPNTGFTDEEINKLSELINDDEDILYFISGFDSFGNDFHLLVVLTSKRVIIAKWIIFNSIEEKKSIPLENINRVSSSFGGIMGVEVIIEHGNNAEYINGVGKESGKLFEYKINKELEKYRHKSEKLEIEEKLKDTQNQNSNNINSIDKDNINLHRAIKDRYLFLKNRYVNCNIIHEIKREENTIIIMTSKNVYYLKYDDDERAGYNYNKLISFITNDVLELIDDDK